MYNVLSKSTKTTNIAIRKGSRNFPTDRNIREPVNRFDGLTETVFDWAVAVLCVLAARSREVDMEPLLSRAAVGIPRFDPFSKSKAFVNAVLAIPAILAPRSPLIGKMCDGIVILFALQKRTIIPILIPAIDGMLERSRVLNIDRKYVAVEFPVAEAALCKLSFPWRYVPGCFWSEARNWMSPKTDFRRPPIW